MNDLKILNTVEKKGKYAYVVKGDKEELSDLEGTKVTIFIKFKNLDDKNISFAVITMLEECKKIVEIVGTCHTTSQRRAVLLSLLKAVEVLTENNDINFDLNIYLAEEWNLKMLKKHWGAKWRENGYYNAMGKVVRNKDFVEPLMEILYGKHLMNAVDKIRDPRDLPDETKFEIRCLSRVNQLANMGYPCEA